MTAQRSLAPRWGLAVTLLGHPACGSVLITLKTEADTNRGRPLQVLVRTVDEQTYRGESYAAAARLIIAPDGSVLRTLVIDPRPRGSRTFCVKVSASQPLALYFLYTAPTAEWKMLLPPRLPWSLTVPLLRGGIAVEHVRERRLCCSNAAVPSPPSIPAPPSPPSIPAPPSPPSIPAPPGPPSVPGPPELPSPPQAPSLSITVDGR
jgi:hypothetical protein